MVPGWLASDCPEKAVACCMLFKAERAANLDIFDIKYKYIAHSEFAYILLAFIYTDRLTKRSTNTSEAQ